MQNCTRHNYTLPKEFFEPLPPGILARIAEQTTTGAVFEIIAGHLNYHKLEIWWHLQNPIVHCVCANILRQQHMKRQYNANYKILMNNMELVLKQEEANWEDIEDEKETFILEGRRITMRDLKVILEATVLLQFICDNAHAARLNNNKKSLWRGKYKMPNGRKNSLRNVCKTTKL